MTTRYDQYGQLDDEPKPQGDMRFVGVNARLDPKIVPPGYVSDAVNMRFRFGVAETRKGFVFPPWANKTSTGTITINSIIESGFPEIWTFTTAVNHGLRVGSIARVSGADQAAYNAPHEVVTVVSPTVFTTFTSTGTEPPATGTPVINTFQTQPWSEVHGVGVFSDPFTFQEYLIIAAEGQVYYTQPHNQPQLMTLPAGVTLTGKVEFTQTFDVLLMHRGVSDSALKLPRITLPWQLADKSPRGDGTQGIPNATHSLFLQNRLFVPNDNDEVAVSDLNDYTRYVPILQEFKVNQGSADELVAIFKFNDTTIIALKEHSLYGLLNVYGNLSALQQDEITTEYGCVARKSIAHVGRDLWFLSELGVMSLVQTVENKLQGVTLPISDPIQPIINRIHWGYASGAVGKVWDSKYYLAVPLDDAEVLGPNLIDSSYFLETGASLTVPVTVGKTYRWDKTVTNLSLTDGTTTLFSSGNITPVASPLTLANVTNGSSLGNSVKEVQVGVNNAILVYDFLNQAWSGYDEAEGVGYVDFVLLTFRGRERLFIVTTSGNLMLYEEDFEDQLQQPYTDVRLPYPAEPVNGDTIQVNGGTVVTVATGVNTSTTLSSDNPFASWFNAVQNIYVDTSTWGFAAILGNPWPAGNATVLRLQSRDLDAEAAGVFPVGSLVNSGIRFLSTDGTIPRIHTTGSDAWVVSEQATMPIVSKMTTRGYGSDVMALADFEWGIVDVQTWAPQLDIDVVTSGVNESSNVTTDWTRDRVKFYEPGDAADYDDAGQFTEFYAPYREDYSVYLGTATDAWPTLEVGKTLQDGTISPVYVHLHQESRITERVNATGRLAQLVITNKQGRIRIMATAIETNEEYHSAGTKA